MAKPRKNRNDNAPALTQKPEKKDITPTEYNAFQSAYNFLNKELFENSLPPVLITLQRHAKAKGYFSPNRFNGRTLKDEAHELALNPDCFTGRSDKEILGTLAHEMAHVWQQTHGTPPRRCYHDKEWATKMKEIGLQPTTTGGPDGKETGQKVTHLIIQGGAYDKAFTKLAKTGLQINWQSSTFTQAKKKANNSKTKYTCPECGQNAWAKPAAQLLCGDCTNNNGNDIVEMITAE